MFILIETSPGLGIIAGWGPLPIILVLRSEIGDAESGADIKIRKNTSVLSINKPEEDSLDQKDSSNLIVIVMINSYPCFLLNKIVSMKKGK